MNEQTKDWMNVWMNEKEQKIEYNHFCGSFEQIKINLHQSAKNNMNVLSSSWSEFYPQ